MAWKAEIKHTEKSTGLDAAAVKVLNRVQTELERQYKATGETAEMIAKIVVEAWRPGRTYKDMVAELEDAI